MSPQQPLSAFPEDPAEEAMQAPSFAAPKPLGGLSAFPSEDADPLGQTLGRAQATSPDTAAKVFNLQLKTGLPHEVIERNLDAVEKEATAANFDAATFRKNSPLVAAWLEQHPLNAQLAHDDLVPLSTMERTLGIGRNVAGALGEGVMGFSQGIWGAIRAGAEALSGEPPVSGLNRMAGQLPPTTIPGLVTPGTVNLYRQPKVQNPDGSTSTVDSLSVNLDGKEVLLPTVTTEGQHFTGTEDERVTQAIAQFEKTGQHLGMFETPEAATAYAQKLHDDYAAGAFDRLPLTERIAEFAGLTAIVAASLAERSKGPQTGAGWTEQQIYGGVASIGQMAPGLVIGAVTGGAGLLATAGISTGGQSYTQAREQGVSAETALLFGGIQGAVEVATEFIPAHRLLGDLAAKTPLIKTLMHQVASEIPGEEIATVLQDLNEWAVLPVNKDRTFSDYLKERPSAAAATLISTVTAVGMTTVTAHGTARMVEKLGETAAESKTIQRSPEAAQAFIAQAVKDGPMETLYQPVDTWTSYWESKGMDPAQMAADLTGSVDAYQRALATGQDLEIPTARYAVKLAATEHNAFFANELRIAPDEMNAREAQAFQEEAIAQPAEPQPVSPIRTALLAELTAAGVEGSTAESYATLYESAIGSVAERAGVDPTALYEKYGLKVERPALAVGAATGLTSVESTGEPASLGTSPAEALTQDTTTLAQSAATLEAPAQQLTLDEEVARITDQPPPVRQARRQTAGAAGVSPTGIERRADQPITGTLAERMAQMRAENPDIQKQGAALAERARAAKPAQPPRVVHTVASEVAEMTAREFGQPKLDRAQGGDNVSTVRATVSGDALAGNVGDQAVALETQVDRGTFSAELFANLFEGEPVAPEGDRLLSAPSLSAMIAHVRAAALKEPKVLGAIVRAVSVDVMNRLFVSERAAEQALHNEPVFEDRAAFDTDLSVANAIDAASPVGLLLSEVARQATEIGAVSLNARGKAAEGGSTARTDQGNSFSQEERASITFADGRINIKLLETADLSSLLHEFGHAYLEIFGDLVDQVSAQDEATLTPQQAQLRADYATLLKWFGVENRAGIQTEQHEQFARGFEAYLGSGTAPSVALQGAFSRFRAWLLGIYSSLKNLNVTLTPEVRGVMDRLVASDQAIADAEARRNVAPIFTTAEDAGMTEKEFGLYKKTIADASRTARETLDAQLMKDVRREQTATWKAQREKVRVAVEESVHQEPVYRALSAMQKGTHPNGESLIEGQEPEPLKLSKTAIVERFGKERLATLPKPYVYTVEGGMDPNAVAELFGFSSGDELLTAISQAPPMKTVIDQETSRRMLAEHGNLLLDGTLHEKARAAVENEDREKVIRAELAALGKLRRTVDPFLRQQQQQGRASARQITTATPSMVVLRDTARATIAAMQVRAIKPQTYWSASRRAAQLAFDAAAKQDVTGAITAKNQELFNLALYREATKALEVSETIANYAKDLGKTPAQKRIGLAHGTLLEQINGVLDRLEFATVPQKTLNRRARIRDWMEAMTAQGHAVEDLPQEILDDARRVNWKELTFEELVGVGDGLKQLEHQVTLKNNLLKAIAERNFEKVKTRLATSIREKTAARPKVLEFRPSGEKWRAAEDWYASSAKLSLLTAGLDGHEVGGPMWESFDRPINAAADTEETRSTETGTAYAAIIQQHYPGREVFRFNDQIFIEAIGTSLSREAILTIGMNWGNQTSRERVLADPVLKLSQPQVLAVLDRLDERDWNFIQAHWDFLNTFWDEIADKQERVTGLRPEKVEALQVETKFGAYRGGYHPLVYDRRHGYGIGQHEATTEAKLALAASYVSAQTARGHVLARKDNVTLPIRLDMTATSQHLSQVIHDLTHHEMLIDTQRLLRDPDVRAAIHETHGDIVYDKLTRLLEDIALGERARGGKPTITEKAATGLRSRAQIAGMAYNVWTALQQPFGVLNGASEVGGTDGASNGIYWVSHGVKRWLRDAASMESTRGWIADSSPMMRARFGGGTATQDLRDVRQTLSGTGSWFDQLVRTVSSDHLTQQTILDSFMWHIGMAQQVADIPTWLGMYSKQMHANPSDEARAIALADQAVLNSQGGGQVKDLAEVQRGGPIAKLFMTFASYGVTVLNSTAARYQETNFRSPASALTFLGHMGLLYAMPALLTEALRCGIGKADCEDVPKFMGRVGSQMLGAGLNGIIYVREVLPAVNIAIGLDAGTRGYEGTAGTRGFQLVFQLAQQIQQGDLDKKALDAAMSTVGFAFKLPTTQAQRFVDGWMALQNHQTANPLALLFGAPKKAAK